jgi:hypothetical protein
MASSLDKLTKGLGKNGFENLDLMTSHYTREQQEMLRQKGAYPYEYMNGLDRLEETSLPPKTRFFSSLTGDDISDTNYKRAKDVWNAFDMKTMRDYHDLYLKLKQTYSSWQTSWKTSERYVEQTTDSIPCGTTQHRD